MTNRPWFGKSAAPVASIAATVCVLLCSAGLAWAEEAAPPSSDGRAVGIFCGAILLALVLYSLYLYCKPLFADEGEGLIWAFLLLLGLMVIKIALLPVLPGLGIDVGSYQAWALRMADVGPARMYEPGYFLDYPPGYLYLLWAAGAAVHALGLTGDMMRTMVESPAIVGDLLLGGLVFAVVRRNAPASLAYAAMALFALNPALLYDTEYWGQSDSVPALLMLLSILMVLEEEYELGWGVAALAVLTKPQALALMPVLGLWTLIKGDRQAWLRSALAFVAFAVVAVAPFQIGHPWSWLFDLYSTTAAYYHETAVNAFNLMALIFGLRRDDGTALMGMVSCFTLGMALVAAMYVFVAWVLWRRPDRTGLFLASFLAITGFFIFAPRMHERYLYPALVVLIPLAVESPFALAILGGMTVTFAFNLIRVKKVLDTNSFLDPRDPWAMAASGANVALFGASVWYAWQSVSQSQPAMKLSQMWRGVARLASEPVAARPAQSAGAEGRQCPPWERIDVIIIGALLVAAAFLRFYRIGHPNEIVFDEVHFVGQARHYLHGEDFLDPHPPLAKLLIALSILIFGDHAWAWRLPNAAIGTALVAITYLLARRMFNSRLTGALAGLFVMCDGMFVVDSRIAVLDIVYVTFGAWSYLLLFRFIQMPDSPARRRTLLWMAVALGLCLSAKLYVPAVTFVLVVGFLVWVLVRERTAQAQPAAAASAPEPRAQRRRSRRNQPKKAAAPAPAARPARQWDAMLERRLGGALALVGGVAAIVYVGTFLPHFALGWWGGIADLFAYYGKVIWYERSVASATHPYAAPWWSWPLMLRPIAYWQDFPPSGNIVATIWGGGNPASWWGALSAIIIVGFQALERRSLPRAFLALGYIAYLGMWIPIGRTLFLYHYMPAVYLGYIALAAVLVECWEGRAMLAEKGALLLTLVPALMLGLGVGVGVVLTLAMLLTFLALLGKEGYDGKFVGVLFVGAVVVLFIYYVPIWLALPIQRSGYYARMWLQGPGLKSWI